MLPRPTLISRVGIASRQFRSPLRQLAPRKRFASTEVAETKDEFAIARSRLVGPLDNAFNRDRLAVREHAKHSAELWRKLCIYVVIPAILLASLNAKNLWDEHWEHWEHLPPIEERVQYPYQNIRSKPFPWGDGDKTLFWNPKVNYHKKD